MTGVGGTRAEGRGTSKVVVITGASSGIGAALAREVARKGHALVITARRSERLDRLADEMKREGTPVLTVSADLADPAAPARIVAETLDRFGSLDVLVNNAGIGLPTLFAESRPDDLRRQLEINLVAPMLLTRLALPSLLQARGTVINVGSAITSIPNPALGAYGATKAGLAYWSLALRRELRHRGVTVCLVEPGPVKTEFFDAFTRLGPEPGTYHPMLDAPGGWMSAPVETVARRIARLIEKPRRRLGVPRRFVWPWRLVGGLFQLLPGLGDLAVSAVVTHYDGLGRRNSDERTRSPRDVASPD